MPTVTSISSSLVNALILASLYAEPIQARESLPDRPHMMVVAANPLAAQAGYDVLKAGGTAIDAAIAVQAVLGLVEPHASGLGGGAMMLSYDASSRAIAFYDGRETAPAAAKSDLFVGSDGKPLDFEAAALGGRSVGVPGAIAALELAYKEHGHLKWADLFQPAIKLATNGFPASARLAKLIVTDAERLARQPAAHDYFFQAGPPQLGTILKNADYADTLRQIAANGADALRRGPIAADIASTVRHDANPGQMTADDLAAYRAIRRTPLCAPYRQATVCTAGPPSAGGLAMLQTLGMLAHFNMSALAADGSDAALLILEAERLAIADRDAYGADSDAVPVPVQGLLAPDYLTIRAQLIDRDHAAANPRAGNPSWGPPPPAQPQQPEHGTSDVAIVDAHGNAVSLTTTIEGEFGDHLMTHGFLLNNELTDFAFAPSINGRELANRVQPGKRPRSSMAPSIALDAQGHLLAVVGSAGGALIPSYVVQSIVGALDWKLDPARVLALGHVGSSGARADVEEGTPAALLAPALKARGEPISIGAMSSGSAIIVVTSNGLAGAADPRRDGLAIGQ